MKEEKIVSPTNEVYNLKGDVKKFCKENGLSLVALKNNLNQIYIPKIIHKRFEDITLKTKGWALYETNAYTE